MGADPWLCPNTPRCPHPGLVHDYEDELDSRQVCCINGCNCGKDGGTDG